MIAGLILFAAAVLYRLLPVFLGMKLQQPQWLPNFSPLAALCLCGAAFLPRRLAIAVPFVALFGTDIVLNAYFSTQPEALPVHPRADAAAGFPLFTIEFAAKMIAFAAVVALGWRLRKNPRASVIFPAVIGGSVFFYIATNTASWLYEPGYAKSAAGWVQALTTGLPEFAQQWPTWKFFRNTLVSDLLFTALFLACMRWGHRSPIYVAQQPSGAVVK